MTHRKPITLITPVTEFFAAELSIGLLIKGFTLIADESRFVTPTEEVYVVTGDTFWHNIFEHVTKEQLEN